MKKILFYFKGRNRRGVPPSTTFTVEPISPPNAHRTPSLFRWYFSTKCKSGAGFTLIEILVVVAIIGILASVILVSVTSARARARDIKRVSDIRQLRTALELYFGNNGEYPTSDEFDQDCTEGNPAGTKCLAPKYIPQISVDPFTGDEYKYVGIDADFAPGAAKCLSYHLGAKLEETTADSDILSSDSDFPLGVKCTSDTTSVKPFNGLNCKDAGTETDKTKDICYDFTP